MDKKAIAKAKKGIEKHALAVSDHVYTLGGLDPESKKHGKTVERLKTAHAALGEHIGDLEAGMEDGGSGD
jgi:hypothetical protein